MGSRVRKLVAGIVGCVVAVVVIALVEAVGHRLWPPPPNVDWRDPAQVAAAIANAPFGGLASVVVAWAMGALVGGAIAARLARAVRPGLSVGILVLAGVVLMLMQIPHPTWMRVSGFLLPVPMAWLGARLARVGSPVPSEE